MASRMIGEMATGDKELVLEEHDWQGHGTGVEVEALEAGTDRIKEPFDPERIDVITRNPTVDLLLSRIRSGSINLEPEFQRRRGIWTDDRQSRLIESLLLKIPLPTLYAAEDEEETWTIVDGIQRLTAITRFIEPEAIGAERLSLQGLEYLGRDLNRLVFSDLPGRLQRRLRETELVVHLIRHGTPEAVMFNIFARINTGGVPLSAQELRHALIPGRARALLKELAETTEFKEATAGSVNDERMADREMVLRFIAFRLTPPAEYAEQDFDQFLRRSMKFVNDLTENEAKQLRLDFLKAMDAAKRIFRDYAFRKRYSWRGRRLPVNKALFEAEAVNLAALSEDQIGILVSRYRQGQVAFIKLMNDPEFDRSVSVSTGDVSRVKYRFRAIGNLFAEVLGD